MEQLEGPPLITTRFSFFNEYSKRLDLSAVDIFGFCTSVETALEN